MKKIILFLLAISLILVLLSGCSSKSGEQSDSPPDGSNEETPDDEKKDNENKENENNSTSIKLSHDDDIVLHLAELLGELDEEVEYPKNTGRKIQEIQSGMQALLVDFNGAEKYFVCGYYTESHEFLSDDFCCRDKYTWVKYDKAEDITEYFENKKCVVAFQIDNASVVKDIISPENEVPKMTHSLKYEPKFENGVNTNQPVAFDEPYIYLNDSAESEIYHSTSSENTKVNSTMPCIYLDERYYLVFESSYVDKSGEVTVNNLVSDLDKYYYFMVLDCVLHIDEYSVTDKNGESTNYAIIAVEDFIYEITLDNREKDPVLCSLFAKVQSDSDTINKLSFGIYQQDNHIIYKEFGKYESWTDQSIYIYIECDYELAVGEDWYEECSDKQLEALNNAFLGEYDDQLSEDHYLVNPYKEYSGLQFCYKYPEEDTSLMLEIFYSDYAVLSTLADLEYVVNIEVNYVYSLPEDFLYG